jgi:SAM-dependent MidA family methyltransferase
MNHDDTAMPPPRELALTPAQEAHARRVQSHIGAQISLAGGWLSFEHFMDLALFAPALGYYSAGAHKIGPGGDFTTAPEVSPLFGGCIARHCAQVLDAVRGGSILEIGAGTGRLAVDVMRRMETLGVLPDDYLILEVSADLRERQQRLIANELPHLHHRVRWLDAPPAGGLRGAIIANEVLDALPVARFSWWPDRTEELGVAVEGGQLLWKSRPADARLHSAVREIAAAMPERWPDGYRSELCPRQHDWTASVTRCLDAGVVLWIDYGLPRAQYYLAERHEGTLLGHFRQRASDDVLAIPGLQDITAWVDFTALAQSGDAAGFDVVGFTTQALFLSALGIEQEMQLLSAADDAAFARLAGQARKLLMPGEMGERFKAMAWARNVDVDLHGFSIRNLLHSL